MSVHTCLGYPGFFREPHWKPMANPEISRVTWQLCSEQGNLFKLNWNAPLFRQWPVLQQAITSTLMGSCKALWTHATSGNSCRFSKATDSPGVGCEGRLRNSLFSCCVCTMSCQRGHEWSRKKIRRDIQILIALNTLHLGTGCQLCAIS